MNYELEIYGINFNLPYELWGTPVVPANFNGHPDGWTPEEGGDLEIIWEPKANVLFKVLEELGGTARLSELLQVIEDEIKDEVRYSGKTFRFKTKKEEPEYASD